MIPKINDLAEIVDVLSAHELDKFLQDASIIIPTTPDVLRKINEELYYRNNKEGDYENNPDEVEINIHGIKFVFETDI